MAAGLGTRLRPFTEVLPKPFLPVMGIPSIQFTLDLLQDSGVDLCVCNIHHLADLAERELRNLDFGRMKFEISDERRELLGSGGGVRKAIHHFGKKTFFRMNADVISPVPLSLLAQKHQEMNKRHGAWMTLALTRAPEVQNREIHLDANRERVTRLGEVREGVLFFSGVAAVEPELVTHLPLDQPSDLVSDAMVQAIEKNKIFAFEYDGPWLDLGSPELWLRAHFQLMEELEKQTLPPRWVNRLSELNQKISDGVWAKSGGTLRPNQFLAPAYWGGVGQVTSPMGPHAVDYDQSSKGGRDFISFGGKRVDFSKKN